MGNIHSYYPHCVDTAFYNEGSGSYLQRLQNCYLLHSHSINGGTFNYQHSCLVYYFNTCKQASKYPSQQLTTINLKLVSTTRWGTSAYLAMKRNISGKRRMS